MNPNQLLPLLDKSLQFAHKLAHSWKDTYNLDADGFQQRFVYQQALAAAHSSRAYGALRLQEFPNEGAILARHLFERILAGRIASESPIKAVELITWELEHQIDNQKDLRRFSTDPAVVTERIANLRSQLAKFKALLNGSKTYKDWDSINKRAKACKLEWAYPIIYASFSEFAHASYGVNRIAEPLEGLDTADFIALLAPMDTAIRVHWLANSNSPVPENQEYSDLYHEFRLATLGS